MSKHDNRIYSVKPQGDFPKADGKKMLENLRQSIDILWAVAHKPASQKSSEDEPASLAMGERFYWDAIAHIPQAPAATPFMEFAGCRFFLDSTTTHPDICKIRNARGEILATVGRV